MAPVSTADNRFLGECFPVCTIKKTGSSAESADAIRLRQSAKRVKQSNLHNIEAPETVRFSGDHFRIVKVNQNKEAIKNVLGLASDFSHNSQVRLPHIATDEAKFPGSFFPKFLEELPQSTASPLLADQQQALAAGIDLVDQPQLLVPLLPGNLLDFKPANRAVAPLHGIEEENGNFPPWNKLDP
jgi:hypothetical protein